MVSYQPLQDIPSRSSTPTIYPPSNNDDGSINSRTPFRPKRREDLRLSRTPSPTPSEARELESGVVDWKRLSTKAFWFRKEWTIYYILLIVVLVIATLTIVYHTQIVNWMTPAAMWLNWHKAGWLVPIAILFVLSFPPLFGHEIIAILCGLSWGLGIGFLIVSAGTLLGEIGNFYAFKYCCRARGEKLEKTRITYACLARVVRDGGFKIAFIARMSAIPGHFTTAVFAICGMNVLIFIIAAILSLPKQFITVYLGAILRASANGSGESKESKVISDIVVGLTIVITAAAMWYMLRLMNAVKPQIIYERRKARQTKLEPTGVSPYSNEEFSSTTDVFHPNASDLDITLNNQDESHYQQWDRYGRAVGYAADPNIISPKPLVANATFLPSQYPRDVEESGNLISKHGRQESTDTVGWQQDENPYPPDSFEPIPSSSLENPHPNQQRELTPTQSNFVNNGPLAVNLSPTTTIHFKTLYESTSSFRSPDSPIPPVPTLPNPFSAPDEQPTSRPESSQPLPQVSPSELR